MDALGDLLSTIFFFLIWLVPVMFITLGRRRTQQRQAKAKTEQPKQEAQEEKPPREDPDNFIARLMEIQGIRPAQTEQTDDNRALHVMETPSVQQYTPPAPQPSASRSVRPVRPKVEESASPLERIEKRYPLTQRAIIYGELLGRPKGLREDL